MSPVWFRPDEPQEPKSPLVKSLIEARDPGRPRTPIFALELPRRTAHRPAKRNGPIRVRQHLWYVTLPNRENMVMLRIREK